MAKKKFFAIVAAAVVLIVLAFGLWQHRSSSPIPKNIQRQVSFAILVPSKTSGEIDKSTIKYDSANKVLSYQSSYSGANLVISEQAFPDQFVDVPQAYDKFLQQLPTISSFESVNGQVNIAQPPDLHGNSLVVTNAKGTFMFVKPSQTISEDKWRQFFNSLEIIK